MKNIVIHKPVEVPEMPAFKKGQKVRVSDKVAEALTARGYATEDVVEEEKTRKAKRPKKEVEEMSEETEG